MLFSCLVFFVMDYIIYFIFLCFWLWVCVVFNVVGWYLFVGYFCITIKFFLVVWCCVMMFGVDYFGFCWFVMLLIWSLPFEINLNTFLDCSWWIVFKIVMLFFKLIDFIIWFYCKGNCTFYMVLLFFVM